MKSKKEHIPVFTAQSFKEAYFKEYRNAESQAAIRASVAHFEIHRRDDFRYKCKETIASHRLDFHLVFIVTGGEGIHIFGNKEYYLKPGMLCFVAPGLITSWQTTVDDHAGYFCAFTSDFFQLGMKDQNALANYPFFSDHGCAVLKLDISKTEYFNRLFHEIEEEYNADNIFKADLIRALLSVLFQKAIKLSLTNNGCSLVDVGNAAQRLTRNFVHLYQKDFLPLIKGHPVTVKCLSAYASEMAVTQNHLNDSVKSVSGKSPGEMIRERILKEASQLLNNTSLSISEIAFLLSFSDPSYFARFYKKYTAISPKTQRLKTKSN